MNLRVFLFIQDGGFRMVTFLFLSVIEVLFANSLGNIFPAFRQCVSKWKADKAFFL